MSPTSRQSTVIAVLFVLLVGAIVVTALLEYRVDDFLKVWGVIGVLVGVVTGAIPSFFFSRAAAQAQGTAQQATETAAQATMTATQAQQEAQKATELHAQAQERVQTLLGLSEPDLLREAQQARPDLFVGDRGSEPS